MPERATIDNVEDFIDGFKTALAGPLPVLNTSNAEITDQINSLGDLVILDIRAFPAVGIQVLGTWVATLAFEASIDGGYTYIPVAGFPVGASGSLGTAAATTTSNNEWVFTLGGFTHFRVRASAFTSGTAHVSIKGSIGGGYASGVSAGGGTTTVDTEFGTAVTPADGVSPIANPMIGVFNLGYNGATWDMLRTRGTGILQVEPAYSFLNVAAGQATTTVKSGAGTFHSINMHGAPTAAATFTAYDNTAASGTKIATILAAGVLSAETLLYDLAFGTGLTIITATQNWCDYTVSYR